MGNLSALLRSADERVQCADPYERCDDLYVVAVHFDASGYTSRRRNLSEFVDTLDRAGLAFVVVECAIGAQAWHLPSARHFTRIRAADALWHKERLINLAIRDIPDRFRKIAWLDADVLFSRGDWARLVSAALERHTVVQCFENAYALQPGERSVEPALDPIESFGSVVERSPDVHREGVYESHGHTGFAWAARREFLENVGLYEACVLGSADHMMAHAICGDVSSACIDRQFGLNAAHRRHFARWATQAYRCVRGRVGAVEGELLHLWHGSESNRGYVTRAQRLAALRFDPECDLVESDSGCLGFAPGRADLRELAASYFAGRREDTLEVGP